MDQALTATGSISQAKRLSFQARRRGGELSHIEGFRLIGHASGRGPGVLTALKILWRLSRARGSPGIEGRYNREHKRLLQGLAHRMEFVRELDEVTYINDSKATNPASVVRALGRLVAPVVLIAGGKEKGCDYSVLSEEL